MSADLKTLNICVIGTGLIGTSIALGLKTRGFQVFLRDINEAALVNAAKASGAQAWKNETPDLVFVATPPRSVAAVIRETLSAYPNAVVTDVASVKSAIFEELENLPKSDLARVVGGHPMAGREVGGAIGAQGNLFVDRPWVLTKTAATSAENYALVSDFVIALGGIPVERSILEHDQAVALISHTPQVVASVLAGELLDASDSQVELAGQGIRDTIRIAGSDPELWTEILGENAKHVATRLSSVAVGLESFARALLAGDHKQVAEKLSAGNGGRDRLPGKHGTGNKNHALLVVRVEDKPGELARLFQVAAKAKVNLEDVRIDHSLGRMTGLVELSVVTQLRPALTEALESATFTVIA